MYAPVEHPWEPAHAHAGSPRCIIYGAGSSPVFWHGAPRWHCRRQRVRPGCWKWQFWHFRRPPACGFGRLDHPRGVKYPLLGVFGPSPGWSRDPPSEGSHRGPKRVEKGPKWVKKWSKNGSVFGPFLVKNESKTSRFWAETGFGTLK